MVETIESLLVQAQARIEKHVELTRQWQAIQETLIKAKLTWLPTKDAAAVFNRDPQALTRWVREGRVTYGIQYRRLGKGYEWNVWALNEWLNKED